MFLCQWFGHLYHALFCPSIPFSYRWRLVALQPLTSLAYFLKWIPCAFSRDKSVIWIPLRRDPGHFVRAVVFNPKCLRQKNLPGRPLHLDIHGGGFLGGLPEYDAPFCMEVARRTGAVVVSTSYRFAPRYTFPTAHEDTQDVASYLVENCEQLWGADPKLMTISGFSAGGNLALGVAQGLAGTSHHIKGSVTFYNPVDLRIPPWLKRKPPGLPAKDPFAFVMPLFDAYPGLHPPRQLHNPLLNPILADILSLPPNMLFIIPTLDILLHEQTVFVERLKEEAEALNAQSNAGEVEDSKCTVYSGAIASGVPEQQNADADSQLNHRTMLNDTVKVPPRYRVESILFENQVHGWLELPSMAIDEQTRISAYDAAVQFIKDVHRDGGWHFNAPA
ncbi:carboxylesterase [Coccidioides immitis H538.4]|uniref:Carboxylesterase n=1 Tax=Coccidioides immitis H538.4 TaxID=396776 RepID=A0A0J8RNQ0_COCIT|nr:carboxylesterase [Coccidioides immitis H538.4]